MRKVGSTRFAPVLLVTLIFAGLVIAINVLVYVAPSDDAFITFGYARNLVDGNGFVFNPGQPADERICGTTTPGFCLLLSGIYAVTGIAPDKGAVVLYWLLLYILVLLLCHAAGYGIRGLIAACLGMACPLWHFAGYGNEVLLFATGGIGVILLAQSRPRMAAFAAGLLFLVRPESVLVWPAIALSNKALLRDLRAHGLWLLGLCVMPATVMLLTGQPLPHSILAKLHQSGSAHGSVWCIARDIVRGFGRWYFGVGLPLLVFTVTKWKSPAVRAASLWLLLAAIALLVGNPPCYPWYLTGLIAPFVLLLAYGLRLITAQWSNATLIAVAILAVVLIPYTYRGTSRQLMYHRMLRGIPYTAIADELRMESKPGD